MKNTITTLEVHETNIKGCLLIKNDIFSDKRGEIWTTWHQKNLKNIKFVHDKFVKSKKNVLRGIHYDLKTWKLVTCINGSIYQVIVDKRKSMKTYNKHFSINISNGNYSLLIPPMEGNAFLTLSKDSVYHYKLSYKGKYFDAKDQFTSYWNDPDLKINWPIKKPKMSIRDNPNS